MSCKNPKIFLYSIGWSEVPDYAEKLQGFIFDMEGLTAEIDDRSVNWNCFGGQNHRLDEELKSIAGTSDLEICLQTLLGTYAGRLLDELEKKRHQTMHCTL